MLRPLIYLCALIGLAGAQVSFTVPAVLDISLCPISFYGRTYEALYVNFSGDEFSLCFNGFFSPQSGSDCIMAPPVGRHGGTYRIWFPHMEGSESDNLISPVAIEEEQECELKMSGFSDTESDLIIANYKTQTTLSFYIDSSSSYVFKLLVDGETVDTLTFSSCNGLYVQQAFDISGCRYAGKVYKRGGVGSDADTCSSVTCDETAVLSTSGCGPLERCLGNNICVLDPVCTVTGLAVIRFSGHVSYICHGGLHELLSGSSVSGFTVMATFRECEGVSSLDSVVLQLEQPGVHIHLEQGGRVQVENTVLNLSSSPLMVHGVQISKTDTGVTAKLSHSSLNGTFSTAVLFDGSTVQIFLSGPAGERLSVGGLCSDSRSLGGMRTDNSCHLQHSNPEDSLMDCTAAADCCHVLKEAPFSACHRHTDPRPFIGACSLAACHHPEVTGLTCQVMEAYVRACSLRGDDTPEAWRSSASCRCFHGDWQSTSMMADTQF